MGFQRLADGGYMSLALGQLEGEFRMLCQRLLLALVRLGLPRLARTMFKHAETNDCAVSDNSIGNSELR